MHCGNKFIDNLEVPTALMVQDTVIFETSLNVYHDTQPYIPEDGLSTYLRFLYKT